jgi:hypothetical protein
MLDAKALSKAIRMKKKNLLKPEMDYAGQEALDPDTADEIKQNLRIGQTMEESGVEGYDHEPPSAAAMGEDDDSQDLATRKKISARINKYFESL